MADGRAAYWQGCKDNLAREGIEFCDLGYPYFRAIQIEGVPKERCASGARWELPHFAVVATKKKMRVVRGNRVELVVRHPYYEGLVEHRRAIDEQIPAVLSWSAPDDSNETGHVEVWKLDNLRNPDAWREDFEWFVENLRRFQRVLTPHVLQAGGWR